MAARGFPEADQLFDKLPMVAYMLVAVAWIDGQFAHHFFFVGEMVPGILRKATEEFLQPFFGYIAEKQFATQHIDRFDQMLVLCVDERNAGFEAGVPNKCIHINILLSSGREPEEFHPG